MQNTSESRARSALGIRNGTAASIPAQTGSCNARGMLPGDSTKAAAYAAMHGSSCSCTPLFHTQLLLAVAAHHNV
jgi:hypothetical protein